MYIRFFLLAVFPISSTVYKLSCKSMTVLTLHVNSVLTSIIVLVFFLQICVQYCMDVAAVAEIHSIQFNSIGHSFVLGLHDHFTRGGRSLTMHTDR